MSGECGCVATIETKGFYSLPESTKFHIEYCPLHSAAGELVKAMRNAIERLRDGDGSDSFFPEQDADAIEIMEQAIAKASQPKESK